MKMMTLFKMFLMGAFATVAFVACSSDSEDGGSASGLSINLTGAQTSGAESSSLTFSLKLVHARSARYLVAKASDIQQALGSMTLEQLLLSEGTAFSNEQLQSASGTGLDMLFQDLASEMEYTCAVYATDGEASAVKSVSVATASGETPGGTGEPAYNAWIGTWKVTSANSLIGGDPISFTIRIGQQEVNRNYSLLGWGISTVAAEQPVVAEFNSEDGKLYIRSGQQFGEIDNNGMQMIESYVGVCKDSEAWTIIAGSYDGLVGTMNADGSARVSGQSIETGNNKRTTIYTMDFFAIGIDGSSYGVYTTAPGFTKNDYPIGPYTLTKSGSAASSKGLRTYFAAPQAKKTGYPVRLLSEEVRTAILAK